MFLYDAVVRESYECVGKRQLVLYLHSHPGHGRAMVQRGSVYTGQAVDR